MFRKSGDKVLSVEAFVYHLLIEQQAVGDVAGAEIVHKAEKIVAVEHIEVVDAALVSEVAVAEIHQLVEHRQGVAQSALGFLGNYMQRFGFEFYAFLRGHILQVIGYILAFDAFEIENLAAREYGGQYFVFLCGGKYEFGV